MDQSLIYQEKSMSPQKADNYTPNSMPGALNKHMSIEHMQRAQEILGSIFSARQFQRNEDQALDNILKECKRPAFASKALFAYPKGKGKNGKQNIISGGSIRLAESLARNWGNVKYGFRPLSQTETETKMEAYAWDMQTNVFSSREVIQKHEIKAYGKTKKLEDERDIYELTANKAARRLRACIFQVIPSYIQEMAIEECRKTQVQMNGQDIKSVVDKLTKSFETLGVTEEMLVEFCGCPLEGISLEEITDLRLIFRSIKDEGEKVETFFKIPETPKESLKSKIEEKNKKAAENEAKQAEAEPEFMSAPLKKKEDKEPLKLDSEKETKTKKNA